MGVICDALYACFLSVLGPNLASNGEFVSQFWGLRHSGHIETGDGGGTTVRLTLDDSVAVAAIHAVQFNESPALPILQQQAILELKFHGHLPTLFKRLIEELRLTSRTASKYRLGMTALGHVPTIEASSALGGKNPNG